MIRTIWLERLLDQERAVEVGHFLGQVDSEHLFITDFAFHSISLIMSKLNRMDALLRFIQDAFFEGAVDLIRLEPGDMQEVVRVRDQFNLDFDDAYQYYAAEKYNLTIVSFDSHYDRTTRGRKTPGEIGL